ncbi:MAG: RDD family protein [endosymbiont of Seepiophila jonesi]|uniref:RDD family protein n=1 Tax=endosymbiont of Lamellibrachia luymesi TaxID=2200907 RepID=A0A370D768_9GAMM|nr:MAG: RDD family protein [endosymbiont of Lamellibrachia luymesi]RDH93669.1 MAG: RDD family protein [endosymbiont of Seepiophila jonesi]
MHEQYPVNLEEAVSPGFFRRIAAMLYDGLLLVALMAVATTLITLPLEMPSGSLLVVYQLFLFEIIPLAFFTGFWAWGGQTLGMRAWRLRLVRADGGKPTWSDALKRHLAAIFSWLIFGLGFLWIFFDPEKLAWHDRMSGTRLVIVAK